ncbi:MAG: restriction endonuclease subunit S [Acetobacteraceae bacterium]|nr:restriction endonuclease subunit S [Acetobacteraceae bacterium]
MSATRWPKVALGEVLRLHLEPVPVRGDQSYPNLGIYSFGRGAFRKPDISGARSSATTLYRVQAGQFIYSRLFAFEGAFAVVPAELDGCYVSNEFPTFDWVRDRVAPRFIAWMFRNPSMWDAAAKLGVGMGDRRRRVHPESLLTLQMPLPPLAEQERIVVRLDAVAERVEQRSRRVAAVEAELQAALRAVFARITAGAPMVRLGEVAPLVRRPVTVENERLYTEIGVRSFYRGTFHRRTLPGSEFTWQSLFEIREGDLVFSNLMAWEQAIAVARREDTGCVGNHRMLTCEVDRTCAVPGFLLFYFQQPDGFAQVLAASPGSIARNKTLSPTQLAAIRVPLPSLDTQKDFDALQAKVRQALAAQATANAELEKLLPALLHETFGSEAAFEAPARAAA